MSGQARFVVLLAAVSALLPLAAALLVAGIGSGGPAAIVGGVVLGATGLLGLVALARVVVVVERGRAGR